MFLAMSEEKRLLFAGYSFRRSETRAQRSVGSKLNCTVGKRGGGGESSLPLSPSSLPSFFFFFVNFSPALYYLNAWNRLLYPVILFCGKGISRLSCLYARAYLKKCRRLKQNFGVFLNNGQNILFFFQQVLIALPCDQWFLRAGRYRPGETTAHRIIYHPK